MFEYWKQFALGLSLERFMAAVENESQPAGPPDRTRAIQLASRELLQDRVPSSDVAAAAWQLSSHLPTASTYDLALVAALYFLQARPEPDPRLDPVRLDARLLAQQWMTEGRASIAVVTRFEEALYSQFP
ncbi:MAG: hypothetical protein EBS47_05510 [Betaproteobacteria bacterium]|jgi:hypothetical protein|nr:hypothetical protein [Betaproteobacteria bacterium]NBT09474.1 hypothetical protein [Betaproteobacteria bacterium]NBU49554.1 hypothetical protein [Betaproteobacteria bacterium]NBX95959.1 hypothetical protein [Betaproteobacteria bacterium]